MKLVLARHGNTFGPDQEGGEKIIVAGCHNDLPLVEEGRRQARRLAQYLFNQSIVPDAIYSSRLLRTWEYAVIVREFFHHKNDESMPLRAHDSLMEFDYGKWAGLCASGKDSQTNEVIARFGKAAWENWQNKRIAPSQEIAAWETTPEEMIRRMQSFFNELSQTYGPTHSTILAITSQGNLSFSRALNPGGMEEAVAKEEIAVQTGKFCLWEWSAEKGWNLIRWNASPKAE